LVVATVIIDNDHVPTKSELASLINSQMYESAIYDEGVVNLELEYSLLHLTVDKLDGNDDDDSHDDEDEGVIYWELD
jgi:hypothetical protein